MAEGIGPLTACSLLPEGARFVSSHRRFFTSLALLQRKQS